MKISLKNSLLSISLLVTGLLLTPAPASAETYDRYLAKELECLAKNIYHEAASETFEGKVAVAQVSVNRSEDDRYPDTICGVISQKTAIANKIICQFSWYCDKRKSKIDKELYNESYTIAKLVLVEGFRISKFDEALYFHALHVNPRWRLSKIGRVGNHVFYKDIK